MTGLLIGYARVSSTDQNLARQVTALGEVHHLFQEKQSGAQRERRTAPRRRAVSTQAERAN